MSIEQLEELLDTYSECKVNEPESRTGFKVFGEVEEGKG